MSARKDHKLVIGGAPRVDLLPPEIKSSQRGASIRRLLGVGIVAMLVVCGAGSALAALQAGISQQKLADAQSESELLVSQQSEFLEVREVAQKVDTISSAQKVGSATEVDWNDYLGKVSATLPGDVVIRSFLIEAGTPIEAHPQATVPLQGSRVATLKFTVNSPAVTSIQAWLVALQELPGFADATPGNLTFVDDGAYYTAEVTIHITSEAYSYRFLSDDEKAAADAAAGIAPVDETTTDTTAEGEGN
jgi:hypothetical protein